MAEPLPVEPSNLAALQAAADQARARYDHVAAVRLCTEALDLARAAWPPRDPAGLESPVSHLSSPTSHLQPLVDLLSRRAEAYARFL